MSLAVLADHMASKGRGPDSMLIHMSPREVQGLQALAMKHGGSLTINPETGLPEAGFLDKLLPAIIGAGLTMAGVPPHVSAMIVGGAQTVRTGDIGKGIQAGLGAYGGANLSAGMSAAGSEAIGSQAAGQSYLASAPGALEGAGAGLSADMAFNLADSGVSSVGANAAQQAATSAVEAASPFDKFSRGFDAVKANPMGYATKDNLKYLAAAAGPAIMAGANVQAKGPQTVTKPGMIRPYSFDPYGGTYTAGTPYEAAPTRSAGGGLMGLAAGGMAGYGDGDDVPRRNGMAQGGMFDFAQRSEPVVRMAKGGIAHYAIGGDTKAAIDAAYAAGDYGKVNELAQANKITAADVADTYKGFDTSGLAGLGINLYAPPAAQTAAAPTYTQYSDQDFANYLTTHKDSDFAKDLVTYNADPAAFNKYLASTVGGFKGSTDTTGGSGTLGIYNQWNAMGVSPDEYYAAAIANDPKYAGWSKEDIQRGYNLDKGAYALAAAEKDGVSDKEWVNFMDTNKYSVNDMAQAFGLSRNEVQRRYDAVKNAEKKVVTPITTVTSTGFYGNDTGNSLTRTPGDITSNPDGTVTVQPNIPGRPDGGFPGMASVRDAYTAGGGRLGYIPYAPQTIEEFEAKYNTLTGGSADAYNYLTGKTKYSPIPSTPTGEIMKPYWESVGRFPVNTKTKKYLFKDGKYVLNPDYVKPSYVLAGEKAAADKETAKAGAAEGKFITVKTYRGDTEQDEPAYLRDDGFYYDSNGTKYNEKGVQVAAGGGLMAMARGGMAQQFNLGDYSDGGRLLKGPGDGVSDSIPATIGNKRPARLADGEFVVPARIVSELGNGSTEAGARKLYAMMDRIQKARRGTVGKGRVAKNSRSEKYLPA